LIAVAHFEGIAREAVHVLKYHGRHAIAGLMGRLMAGVAREVEVDCVAPIPLHSTRLRERGYDQAALLARSVAHALALPHQGKALKRVRATRQQVTLDALARQANVAGAFASPRAWDGERILLIDDVSTTGATMRSAAGALKASGAGAIVGLVFARADG
jgi:ComF family protein